MKTSNRIIALEIFAKRAVEELVNIIPCPHFNDRNLGYTIKIGDTRISPNGRKRKSSFGWCSFREKMIMIDRVHAEKSSIEEVKDTILHEIAHARAYHLHGEPNHGAAWKMECRIIGAVPKATAKAEGAMLEHLHDSAKWTVAYINGDHVEKVCTAKRKLKSLQHRKIKGREETSGKLFLVPTNIWKTGDTSLIIRHATR